MKSKPTFRTCRAALIAAGVLFSSAHGPVAQASSIPAASESTDSVTLNISALNRVFDDLDAGFVPIEQGPVTIVISSPAHRLEVFANRLTLTPSERHEEGVQALFEVDLEGWGDLVAAVQTAMGSTPYQDRVVVERQMVSAEVVVRLVTTEIGYDMTLLEALTPTVAFHIESDMAREIVETCLAFAALLPGLGCDGISASLARVEVPLPAAGTQYEIDASFLTAEERAVLDRFALPPIEAQVAEPGLGN